MDRYVHVALAWKSYCCTILLHDVLFESRICHNVISIVVLLRLGF